VSRAPNYGCRYEQSNGEGIALHGIRAVRKASDSADTYANTNANANYSTGNADAYTARKATCKDTMGIDHRHRHRSDYTRRSGVLLLYEEAESVKKYKDFWGDGFLFPLFIILLVMINRQLREDDI
jgi:hypothetical protein